MIILEYYRIIIINPTAVAAAKVHTLGLNLEHASSKTMRSLSEKMG